MKANRLKAKDPLMGRLLTYSAAAGALLALGQEAEGQITYTDVDPDSTLVGEYGEKGIYELDINNDGTVDLQIIHGNEDVWSSWQSARVLPQNNGGVATAAIYYSAFETSYYMGLKFDKDALIGPEVNFNSSSTAGSMQLGWAGTSYSVAYTSGQWAEDGTDKYLGVRFSLDEGSTFHYGWVRMDVAPDMTSIVVKDYAYEGTADKAISAGDFESAIENELSKLGIKVYSGENSVIISDLAVDNAQADIFNVLGQLVHSTPIQSGRTEIQMDNTGLYIVNLMVNGELLSKKVLVK